MNLVAVVASQVFDISPMSLLKQRLMGSAVVAVELEEAGQGSFSSPHDLQAQQILNPNP